MARKTPAQKAKAKAEAERKKARADERAAKEAEAEEAKTATAGDDDGKSDDRDPEDDEGDTDIVARSDEDLVTGPTDDDPDDDQDDDGKSDDDEEGEEEPPGLDDRGHRPTRAARKHRGSGHGDERKRRVQPIGPPNTKLFWIGALLGGPCQNYILGGECLHFESGGGAYERGKSPSAVRFGQLRYLTKEKVEKIIQDARRNVGVPIGKHGRMNLTDMHNRYYQRGNGDLPVGCFVYVILVSEANEDYGPAWASEIPDALFDREDGPRIITRELAVVAKERQDSVDREARRRANLFVSKS